MVWSIVPRLVPFLLASGGTNRAPITRLTTVSSSPSSTVEQSTPSISSTVSRVSVTPVIRTPNDLLESFAQLYRDLERPGRIHRNLTDTLRVSFVPPPTPYSTWRTEHLVVTDDNVTNDVHNNDTTSKPLALFLPGLDGYGISAATYQYDDLSKSFELWRLSISPADRSSFSQVVTAITDFLCQCKAENENREIILLGDSCGGLFALASAYRLFRMQQQQKKQRVGHYNASKSVLSGLVLVNPATSFDRTTWDQLIPIVTSLQYLDNNSRRLHQRDVTAYSVLGSLLLFSFVPDFRQLRRIIDTFSNLPDLDIPPSNAKQWQSLWQAMTKSFAETGYRLSPDLLEHRTKSWLLVGPSLVNNRLEAAAAHNTSDSFVRNAPPTLVLAGREDRILPSVQEADRLERLLAPNCEKLLVPNRGHFLLDDSVNLTEAILYSKIMTEIGKPVRTKPYDPILDWKRPSSASVVRTIKNSVSQQRTLHSPIFFSTDNQGKRWKGLFKVPNTKQSKNDGPLLFVGNHQFAALDLRLLVAELIEQRDILPRGLAHPVTFESIKNRPPELQGRRPGLQNDPEALFNNDFVEFGAVKVTPRNYYRMMQTKQDALLFPGGAKEALSDRRDYPLFWPSRVDFVRTAARFNATIVPFSAIGMLDSVSGFVDPQRLVNVPFFGRQLKELFDQNLPAARYDEAGRNETVRFPLAVPSLPARNYFLFGAPIRTNDIDPNDNISCMRVYQQCQTQIRQGLDDLLRARQRDPYLDTPRRLAYERIVGKQAPTFSIDELNLK